MKNTGIVIPQSGPELRRKIKDLVGDQLDRVQEKIGEVENRIDEIRSQCAEK